MVEHDLAKVDMRVRFPSLTPFIISNVDPTGSDYIQIYHQEIDVEIDDDL